MHYSSDEIEAMGEGECSGNDWWQSKVITMGSPINSAEIVRPIRQDMSLGNAFPLENIVRQVTNDGNLFVGDAFIGATFVGESGCYGVDDMGFLKKIRRGAGNLARGAGRGVSSAARATGRGIAKGTAAAAKHTGKYAAKGAMLATAPARQAAFASAWLAFAPVRLTVNQITNGIVRGARGKGKALTSAQAKLNLYASMSKSRNPILRGGVALLKQFGPGTSPKVRLMGDSEVGAAPAAAGVAALNAALLAAKGVLIKASVAAATGAAVKLTSSAFGPGESEPRPAALPVSLPSEDRPEPESMEVAPSDAEVDNLLDPDPSSSETSGWEAGCCA